MAVAVGGAQKFFVEHIGAHECELWLVFAAIVLQEVKIELPKGVYSLGVRFCVPLGKWQPGVQAEHKVVVGEGEHVVVEFTSRERLWNLFFDIDLMLWALNFFITLP